MGMTQYFYAVEKEDIIDDFDFRDNHGDKYGWSEFTNFGKETGIYNWIHALWEKKVAASLSHDSDLTEEYLLLDQNDIAQLEKDFRKGKIFPDTGDKENDDWLKSRFQDFLNDAKQYLKCGLVIYYAAR